MKKSKITQIEFGKKVKHPYSLEALIIIFNPFFIISKIQEKSLKIKITNNNKLTKNKQKLIII